tara:strand:- start:5062 stop:5886 length:825 start_codon:yes stop_codon:yes gene_type:complete
MNKIRTSCDECIFAKYSDNKQTGCTLNRPEKLGIYEEQKNEEGKTSYLLDRVCNVHRPKAWLEWLDFEESLDPEKAVLEEIYPRMGYFIRLDTKEDDAINKLETTLKSITENSKHAPNYVVVITDKVEFNEEIWGLFIKFFGDEDKDEVETMYHVVQLSQTPETVQENIDAAFHHAQNSWIMTLTSGDTLTKDIAGTIHKIINIDMRQVVLVEPHDGYNGMIFPAYLFKFLNGNKVKVFQDEIVDGRGFLEKVRDAAKRTNTNNLLSWEEFNAS